MSEDPQTDAQARIAELERQLAQAEAKLAASGRGVRSGGAMSNNIIATGDGNTIYGSIDTLTIQSAVFLAPPAPGQVDPKELLWTYLNRVVNDTRTLELSGVDPRIVTEQQAAKLELAAVYTELDTVRWVQDEFTRYEWQEMARHTRFSADELPRHVRSYDEKRQSALGFVAAESYAVLLGDPGSGKTTLANFLALCLAGQLLGMESANVARLGDQWTLDETPLPLRVVLRTFAVHLRNRQNQGDSEGLWHYIERRLGSNLVQFVPLLNRHLLTHGGLLILDGLDEVPEAGRQREQVKTAILEFRRQFPKVRILLTSRTYAYQRQQWQLPGFADTVLAPFSPAQIDSFVDRWYTHMAAIRPNLSETEAQGRARLLKDALGRQRHLQDLAPNPLLLTLMASLHAWRGGTLPNDREQLYDESVKLLLDLWEKPKVVVDERGEPVLQTESAAEWLNCPQPAVKQALDAMKQAFGCPPASRSRKTSGCS